jgi:nucleotide-binding universal stress UspA family protein
MTYKTILTPIMYEETAKAQLESALMIAGAFHAHVHAKHVRQRYTYYPPVAYYPLAPESMVISDEVNEKASEALAAKLRAIFDETSHAAGAHVVPLDEALHQNGVTVSWGDGYGLIQNEFGQFGRIADLSIVTLPGEKTPVLETAVFESLLMSSGRPVLLAPREGLKEVPKRAAIAWDGSLPAARAMQAAMPFLEQAQEVVVVTVGEVDSGTPSCQDAANYLERCGVKASAKEVDWPKRPVAERILNQAEAHTCDLVVMGGYSHARLFETMLGGVTRHMLAHADLSVLMAH